MAMYQIINHVHLLSAATLSNISYLSDKWLLISHQSKYTCLTGFSTRKSSKEHFCKTNHYFKESQCYISRSREKKKQGNSISYSMTAQPVINGCKCRSQHTQGPLLRIFKQAKPKSTFATREQTSP